MKICSSVINIKETHNGDKRILIIDDDQFIIRILKMKLKEGGYQVFVARNGYEGLKNVKRYRPHLLITDLSMPRMDGWQLCEKINELQDYKPKIIIITSLIDRYQREKIKESPNIVFLDKPISPKNILSVVHSCLTHKERERNNYNT